MRYNRTNQAILVVSFGTSFNDKRSVSIGAIESTIAENFPDFTVRRAFTSEIIKSKLLKRDNIAIDNVGEALQKLCDDGFARVYIQPTHMIEGDEFNLILRTAEEFKDRFECIKTGCALMSTTEDLDDLIAVLDRITSEEAGNKAARVFMGHGSAHAANSLYTRLQERIEEKGIKNMFIGTVEASPGIDDVLKMLAGRECTKIILSPLMIVAGDHATNDMAGSEEDSWKSILEGNGYEVSCRLTGLGSEYDIQELIVRHCRQLLERC